MKHIIITMSRFMDKDLLSKYLEVTKNILIPSLKSQINQNFEWALLVRDEDILHISDYLKYPFLSFGDMNRCFDYVKENNINIQTRHDMDDWMSPDYVEKIQQIYQENVDRYETFLIQSQPIKMDYHTQIEYGMPPYCDTRTSMHLSICQKKVIKGIYDKGHGSMYQIADKVITIPAGCTKWVIHGNNKSKKSGMI